jgi:hypothetical protein
MILTWTAITGPGPARGRISVTVLFAEPSDFHSLQARGDDGSSNEATVRPCYNSYSSLTDDRRFFDEMRRNQPDSHHARKMVF